MKSLFLALFAAATATATLHGQCATCSTSEQDKHAHAATCSSEQLSIYFDTQAGLANDDLAAAQEAAKSMLKIGDEKSCSLEDGSCCSAELAAATQIAEASDIAAARLAFKSWSNTLIAKLDEEGLAEGSAIAMRCPMAFNNKGGSWLQSDKDLKNPYYGAMMLKCGTTQKEYGATAAHDHSEHSSTPHHQH